MIFPALIKKPLVIIFILICIGFGIRVWSLGSIPGGFHEDEAHVGYNAYSLLKTTRDKNNVFLPIAVDQFGDFRPAGIHYLTIPSIALFGLNEFATRLPVAIFGALSILIIYLLSLEIFQRKLIAVITACLLTFNPWSIIASRSTSESVVALFFVMLGAYFAVRILRGKNAYNLVFSFLSFCISFLFYHAARYFAPFLIVYFFAFLFLQKKISKKIKIFFTAGAVITLTFLGLLFKFGSGSGRVQEISIFSFPSTHLMLWQQASEDFGQNVWITRFFHNLVTGYSYTAFTNYFAHFSGDFLFFKGGLPPRYMVPWFGNFFLLDGLLFIIGMSFLIHRLFTQRNKDTWIYLISLAWVILGPIPAAFTFEDIPHFQRSIMMQTGFLLIAGFGAVTLLDNLKTGRWKVGFALLLGVIYLYGILLFNHDYFRHMNLHQPWYRNEGQKDLVLSLDKYVKDGFHIDMTTQNANRLIFYLFFNKIDPAYFQKSGSPRDHNGLQFGNFIFDDSTCPSNNVENLYKYKFPILFVDAGDCKPKINYEVLKSIKRADNTIVFNIVKYIPPPKISLPDFVK